MPAPNGIELPEGVMFYIGNFVVCWGRMEFISSSALRDISGLPNPAARCFTNNMDLRGKISALKALAVLHIKSATPSQRREYAKIERWLNYIESTLIPERNRIIHDEWDHHEGLGNAASRTKRHTTVVRPQSHQLDVVLSSELTFTAEQLSETCKRVERASWAIGLLTLLITEGKIPDGFSGVAPVPSP
jgi:hypothetical protein